MSTSCYLCSSRNEKDIEFFLHMIVTYYLPPVESGKVGTRIQTATFERCLNLPINPYSGKVEGNNMLEALRDVGFVDAARISSGVLSRCNRLLARSLAGLNSGDNILVRAAYVVCVEKLPPVTSSYVGALPLDELCGSDIYYDDADIDIDTDGAAFNGEITFRVCQGSNESIRKVTIKEALTCSVCLVEAPIGSVLARLPCSHRYHVECIGSWLERKNTCPVCRFELPAS